MKNLSRFCFFSLLCYNIAIAQTPTFADPPGPEHVLVVYNGNSTLSDSVKEYYKNARQRTHNKNRTIGRHHSGFNASGDRFGSIGLSGIIPRLPVLL